MPKLIMLKGLPASGKSTFAKTMSAINVNKDNIRKELGMLDPEWQWSPSAAKEVLRIRDERIKAALDTGKDVVSSDTNLAPKHERRLRDLAKQCKAEFEVLSFLHVPLETCIVNDRLRPGGVGETIIRRMHDQYVLMKETEDEDQPIVPYEARKGTPKAIICDIDGTLALFDGLRGPYEFEKCAEDKINTPVRDLIHACTYYNKWAIVYLTGRNSWARGRTLTFLDKHCCPIGPLHMRADNDQRSDTTVKLELFNQFVRDEYDVQFVIDDRNRVVALWRQLGLTCLQCAEGDF